MDFCNVLWMLFWHRFGLAAKFGNVLWKPHLPQHAKITGTTRHMHIHMEKAKWWAQTRFHTPLVLLKTNHGGRGGHTLDTTFYYASPRCLECSISMPLAESAKMTDFFLVLAMCCGSHICASMPRLQEPPDTCTFTWKKPSDEHKQGFTHHWFC